MKSLASSYHVTWYSGTAFFLLKSARSAYLSFSVRGSYTEVRLNASVYGIGEVLCW